MGADMSFHNLGILTTIWHGRDMANPKFKRMRQGGFRHAGLTRTGKPCMPRNTKELIQV